MPLRILSTSGGAIIQPHPISAVILQRDPSIEDVPDRKRLGMFARLNRHRRPYLHVLSDTRQDPSII